MADRRRLLRDAQAARLHRDPPSARGPRLRYRATEVVHIGQAVMTCGGTVDHLVDTVFNYPTLSETYKVAALEVVNKMRAVSRFGA